MLLFTHNKLRILISDEKAFTSESLASLRQYEHKYKLGVAEYLISSCHTVIAIDETLGKELASCILMANGGASGVHEHSALVRDNQCLIAVGPYLASLRLPSLELNWFTEVDPATCFGIFESEKHKCLVSHGELEVARISYGGDIAWRNSGADIFTNGLRLFDDHVEVIDWNNDSYKFDLSTGRLID